jgi:Glycosyltransferase
MSNKQKTVIVCVTNDLVTDQRVHKTCTTFVNCGFNVIETGRLLKNSVPLNFNYKTRRVKHCFNTHFLFYAEYNIRLFFYLIFKRFDLVFANDLDTLPAAFFVAKIKNKPLIYDSHELFSQLPEIVNRPKVKNVWLKIEKYLLPKVKHSITVCQSIADYYKKLYNIDMQVVRNIPYYKYGKIEVEKFSFTNKKIILYQGALNVGRGLEWAIDAMKYVDDAALVIVGTGDVEKQIKQQVIDSKLSDKVFFTGQILPKDLARYTASASIGLCLLENRGLSYYYALPNRIFDFIHAGVPVLASNFPEMQNIINTYHTGVLIENNDPKYIAENINNMLETKFEQSVFEQAAKELCWENEEKTLLKIINGL